MGAHALFASTRDGPYECLNPRPSGIPAFILILSSRQTSTDRSSRLASDRGDFSMPPQRQSNTNASVCSITGMGALKERVPVPPWKRGKGTFSGSDWNSACFHQAMLFNEDFPRVLSRSNGPKPTLPNDVDIVAFLLYGSSVAPAGAVQSPLYVFLPLHLQKLGQGEKCLVSNPCDG